MVFCHGGISDSFVKEHVPDEEYDNPDEAIEVINSLGVRDMWNDLSPIWLRPQYNGWKMYKADELLQVVGHTPVEKITRNGNVISCDVFSSHRDESPIGTEKFPVVDTETWEFTEIEL